MTEDIATAVLALRPRDGLYLDPAGGAFYPPHGVGKYDRDIPNRDELKLSGLGHVVVSGAGLGTPRADGLTVSSRDDLGEDTL